MSRTTRNYYDLLGVLPSAGMTSIKRAYRTQARRYHPDLNPGDPFAEQRFKELQIAYDVLKDPFRRTEYDRSLGFRPIQWSASSTPAAEARTGSGTDASRVREADVPPATPAAEGLGPQSDAAREAAEQIRRHIHRAWREGFGSRTWRIRPEGGAESGASTSEVPPAPAAATSPPPAQGGDARAPDGERAHRATQSPEAESIRAGTERTKQEEPKARPTSPPGPSGVSSESGPRQHKEPPSQATSPETRPDAPTSEPTAATGSEPSVHERPASTEPPGERQAPESVSPRALPSARLSRLQLLVHWTGVAALLGVAFPIALEMPHVAGMLILLAPIWMLLWKSVETTRHLRHHEARLEQLERQVRFLKKELELDWEKR